MPYGVGMWKNIKRGWGKSYVQLEFEVGDRSRIRFWHDVWCRDGALKEVFLEVHSVARAMEAFVAVNLVILSKFFNLL